MLPVDDETSGRELVKVFGIGTARVREDTVAEDEAKPAVEDREALDPDKPLVEATKDLEDVTVREELAVLLDRDTILDTVPTLDADEGSDWIELAKLLVALDEGTMLKTLLVLEADETVVLVLVTALVLGVLEAPKVLVLKDELEL